MPFGKKTPIPEFPKREHKVESAKVDPVDPFAEWERKASEIKAANDAKPAVSQHAQSYVKPEPPKAAPKAEPAAPAAAPKAPARPAFSYPSVRDEPAAPKAAPAAPKAAPAAPVAPAAPKAQPKPAAKAAPADDFDFDLDSIMAEFRDL